MSSRYVRSAGPLYQGMFSDFFVTLSPSVADTGMIVIFGRLSSDDSSFICSTISLKRFSSYPTRSILFTANTKYLIPISAQILACLLVCTSTPCFASMRMTARSANDAPTAMFLVYSSWPGVSATMKLLLSVVKYLYATSMVIPCSRSAISPSRRSE